MKFKFFLLFVVSFFLSEIGFCENLANSKNISSKNAYQFSFDKIDGSKIDLSSFKNKVVLVVNTASKCGFTPQYKSLQTLYQKYQNKGLVIIAIPSADFGNQEFSDNQKISQFTDHEFKISFPITTLNKVSGDKAHPFYLWANQQAGFFASPKWNFHKYLIDKNGKFAAWFSSATDPMSNEMVAKIEDLLQQ
jgi:glutathione peroxidase